MKEIKEFQRIDVDLHSLIKAAGFDRILDESTKNPKTVHICATQKTAEIFADNKCAALWIEGEHCYTVPAWNAESSLLLFGRNVVIHKPEGSGVEEWARAVLDTAKDATELSVEIEQENIPPLSSHGTRYEAGNIDGSTHISDTGKAFNVDCGSGWDCRDDGIYRFNDKTERMVKFCNVPIVPQSLIETERGNYFRVAFKACGKEWKEAIYHCGILSGLNDMAQIGGDTGGAIHVDNKRTVSKYLSDCLTQPSEKIALRTEKGVFSCGWHGDSFAPFDDGMRVMIADDPVVSAVHKRGTLEAWKNAVRTPMAEAEGFRIMMAAAFAAPLVGFVGAQSFVAHLWGATGCGKTVTLRAALSSTGNWKGLLRSLSGTDTGKEMLLGSLRNLPLGLDELQTIRNRKVLDGGKYDDLLYNLTEGVGKSRARAKSGGEVITAKATTWNTVILTTGEESIMQDDSGGGAVNRGLEIHAVKALIEDPKTIMDAITANYGHAMPLFVKDLKTMGRSAVSDRVSEWGGKVRTACPGVTGKQLQIAAHLLAADEIALSALDWAGDLPGLTPEDLHPFLKTDADVSVAERAWEYTCGIITANLAHIEKHHKYPGYGEVWGTLNDATNPTWLFMNATTLEKILKEGRFPSVRSLSSDWEKAGHMERQNGRIKYNAVGISGAKPYSVKISATFIDNLK